MTEERSLQASKNGGEIIEGGQAERQRARVVPKVDLLAREDSYVVFADVPGTRIDDVELVLEKSVLGLRAVTDNTVYERSIDVGDRLDSEKVSAALRDGVLRVELPRTAESLPRKISVH